MLTGVKMGKNTETELKLQITDRKIWCDILESSRIAEYIQPNSLGYETLEACYYDTPQRALRHAGLAYRIRREGGQWVATVKGGGKSAGGLHMRQEWNVPVKDCMPSIKPFLNTTVGERIQTLVGQDKLMLLFITRFERRTAMLKTPDGSIVEAAADRGEIIAGDNREQIMELELELKAGCTAALLELGAALAEQYPLLLEPRSKYYRGLLIAGLAQDDYRCAAEVETDKENEQALISAVTQVLNAQSCFLRLADRVENILALRHCAAYLAQVITAHKAEMRSELYKAIHDELDRFQRAVNNKQGDDLFAILGTGRYTALLLKLWAWAVKRNPEGD